MYIKIRNLKNEIQILNLNVDSYDMIEAIGTKLYFVSVVTSKKDFIEFKSNKLANVARERVFYTLGLKSPNSNVLDLTMEDTSFDKTESNDYTLMEIAEKLNLDPRELRIVTVANQYKISDTIADNLDK